MHISNIYIFIFVHWNLLQIDFAYVTEHIYIYIEWHETASRTSLWYCPTQRAVNVRFSRHQSRSLRESLYGRRYIRRSRDPRRCLLEAFTAFRLSIKDKVSRVSLFRHWLISCSSHSVAETLTRIPSARDEISFIQYDVKREVERACKNAIWVTWRLALSDPKDQKKMSSEIFLTIAVDFAVYINSVSAAFFIKHKTFVFTNPRHMFTIWIYCVHVNYV